VGDVSDEHEHDSLRISSSSDRFAERFYPSVKIFRGYIFRILELERNLFRNSSDIQVCSTFRWLEISNGLINSKRDLICCAITSAEFTILSNSQLAGLRWHDRKNLIHSVCIKNSFGASIFLAIRRLRMQPNRLPAYVNGIR